MSDNIVKPLAILASLATIIGTCIAAIALIPAFGQWINPRAPNIPANTQVLTSTSDVIGHQSETATLPPPQTPFAEILTTPASTVPPTEKPPSSQVVEKGTNYSIV